MLEAAVTFACGSDDLVGILHRPEADERDLGILIVVGGPQYRVGSHRQFVLMARSFAAAGYPTFRFDYRGMGDSTGEPRTFERIDDDICAAIDTFLSGVPSLRRLAIFGLCDAASAAWIYCPKDPRLVGLILANPWVRTGTGEAKAFVRHYYLERIVQRSFWTKVFTGGLQPLTSIRSLVVSLHRALRGMTGGPSAGGGGHFLERMWRGAAAFARPVLILVSDRDLTAREFEDFVRGSSKWGELMARATVEVRGIRDADHTFSGRDALASATHIALDWLAVVARR